MCLHCGGFPATGRKFCVPCLKAIRTNRRHRVDVLGLCTTCSRKHAINRRYCERCLTKDRVRYQQRKRVSGSYWFKERSYQRSHPKRTCQCGRALRNPSSLCFVCGYVKEEPNPQPWCVRCQKRRVRKFPMEVRCWECRALLNVVDTRMADSWVLE